MKSMLVAVSATALLCVASTQAPAVELTATPALIMGGTGSPTPSQDYMDAAVNTYVRPSLGGTYDAVATYTPEEGLGLLPNETMSIAESTRAGLPYLEEKMAEYPGQAIVVFGFSQSGAIGAIEKNKLATYAEAHPDAPVPDVTFVLLACGCRPNGALEFRLGDAYDTSIVDSRARTDTPFKTVDVAWQYDIASDWPLYPLNFLAVVNVVLGGVYVHGNYLPNPQDFGLGGGAVPSLEGVEGVTAPGIDTTYYLMPTEHLPVFGPLRTLGIPESLIAIVEPLARVVVEWGYDRTIPPWQPTPFRLIPTINPVTAAADLVNALGQGVDNAFKALGFATQNSTSPASTTQSIHTTATDDPLNSPNSSQPREITPSPSPASSDDQLSTLKRSRTSSSDREPAWTAPTNTDDSPETSTDKPDSVASSAVSATPSGQWGSHEPSEPSESSESAESNSNSTSNGNNEN